MNLESDIKELLSCAKSMKLSIEIVIYTDESGHVKKGSISRSFWGIGEIPEVLASLLQQEEHKKTLLERILGKR